MQIYKEKKEDYWLPETEGKGGCQMTDEYRTDTEYF